MANLYVTADEVGIPTGGGLVTLHESEALLSLGPVEVWDRKFFDGAVTPGQEPWKWDDRAADVLRRHDKWPRLAHFYAGAWGKTVKLLKEHGCAVSVTVAAHDRGVSREEHEKLGIPFNYPHLVQDDLWQRYAEGYRLADWVVCPGSVPESTVRAYGPDFEGKKIEVIPHGCELPESVKPLPKTFTVGYLGSFGPDKGVKYLLEAWKKLKYKDATLLLGGGDSTGPFGKAMVRQFGGGNVRTLGRLKEASEFYEQISLFVCPAATEGFNLECLEAMAHGRVSVCSLGAGASDVATDRFRALDVGELMGRLDFYKKNPDKLEEKGKASREVAKDCTWALIRERYRALWERMLGDDRP